MRWTGRIRTPPASIEKPVSTLPSDLSGPGVVRRLTLALGVVASCIFGGPPAYPLYVNPEHPRAPDEVAVFTGPLAAVDGVDVHDKGRVFALLPGCHAYTFLKEEGHFGHHGGRLIILPRGEYALMFEAGHTYSVEPITSGPGGLHTFTIRAYDRDPKGNIVLARACSPLDAGRS
jgi:hypothetical protein